MEAEGEKNLEELSFVPSAVSEPHWALHMCDDKCRAKRRSSTLRPAHTIDFCRKCFCESRAKQGEADWFKVEGVDRAESFSSKV